MYKCQMYTNVVKYVDMHGCHSFHLGLSRYISLPQIEKAGGLVVRDAHKVWRVGPGSSSDRCSFHTKSADNGGM